MKDKMSIDKAIHDLKALKEFFLEYTGDAYPNVLDYCLHMLGEPEESEEK